MDLGLYEQGIAPFTASELHAIANYQAAVCDSGLRDCFDEFTTEHARWHETEYGQDATRAMLVNTPACSTAGTTPSTPSSPTS